MGSMGSKVMQKLHLAPNCSADQTLATTGPRSLLVFTRRGSMYLDEDGDLAHEFYEEVVLPLRSDQRRRLRRMRRVSASRLRPQGNVQYRPQPRISNECSLILAQG